MKKLFSLGLFSLLLLFIACGDDKKTEPDTKNPVLEFPQSGDTILAEANVPYDLKFGYFDNDKVATAKIEIEGEVPITNEINNKEGIVTIPFTFTTVGTKKLTVTLTDASQNIFVSEGIVVKVGAQGMNWLANGELTPAGLTPEDSWAKFPSWSTFPLEKGDNGWGIGEGIEGTSTFQFIAFWAGANGDQIEYTANITQSIVSLPNGTYTLSIRYSAGRAKEDERGPYDPSTVQLKAEEFGETDFVLNLPKTEINADESNKWEITSNDIVVTKGTCKVGVYVNALDAKGLGNWANIDYFRLIRKQQ